MPAPTPIFRPPDSRLAVVALLALVACSGPAPRTLEPSPVPGSPAFDVGVMRLHLSGLAGQGPVTTGGADALRSASYASVVFSEARLQPLTAGEYRQVWYGPLNRASDAAVARLGRDTVMVRTGMALRADGRSDRGRVEAPTLWRGPAAEVGAGIPATVAWVGEADTTTEALVRLAAAGVRAVLLPGGGQEPVSRGPIPNLLVVGVAPDALARLFPGAPERGTVRYPVAVEVASSFDPASPVVGAAGLVPGRDPWAREELVVVAAPLDVRPGESPIEAAALVEAARVLSEMASRGASPAATTLFLLWSGSRQGGTGVEAWVRNPGWERSRIRRIVVAGALPASITHLERPATSLARETPGTDPAEAARHLAHRLLADIAPDLGIPIPYLPPSPNERE